MRLGQGTDQQRHRDHSIPKAALCLALLIAIAGNSSAFDLDYEIGLAARHSDNINLSEVDPISDTFISPRLYFEAGQSGRDIEMSAQGDLEYRHYLDDTFDDDPRGTLAGSLRWTVLPQRLDLIVQDYLSLQPVDELAAFSPGNQQQTNVFTAGPTLHARFGSATHGQLDLRYINSYAEENDAFDSDRYSAAARIIHNLGVNDSVSVNLEAADVQFDLVGRAPDYRRYDAFLNSSSIREAIDLSVDLGTTRLELDGRGSESYPLARAIIDWRVTPRSALSTTLHYQLNDAAQSLMTPREFDRRDFNDFIISDSVVEPDIFRERLARMRYSYRGERLDLRVAPYYRRMRYIEELVVDQDRRGARINIDYRLKPRLTLTAYAGRENREYLGISRKDKDLVASIGLANRFTRHWTGRVDLLRRERDSNEFGRSFDENAVTVSFSYQR